MKISCMKCIKNKLVSALVVATTAWATSSAVVQSEEAITDVEKLIKAMTLEEKIDFLGGTKNFHMRAIERLGIPQIRLADGPVGLRNLGASTAYPAAINLAATWDSHLAYETGKALGLEARSKNVHMVLGPGVNIHRFPLTGRNFEYMGEDPFLAGVLAKDYILGLQDQGVMGSVKHYAANNQEFDRNNVSSDVDERTLHEIYLPAFKKAAEANVASVMTGYNLVNGIHMSQHNYLINDILKNTWKFSGFVVSDWVSTYDGVAAANAGLDLEMPSGTFMNRENLLPAIKNGKVSVATIDDKVRRILSVYDRFGLLKNADLAKDFVLDKNYVRQVAIESARGGVVLLKNEKNALPINLKKIKTIAVIGPNATPVVSGGGGSSFTKPEYPLSLLDAIKAQVGENVKIIYEQGAFVGAPFPPGIWDSFPFYTYKEGKKVQGAHAEFFNGKALEGPVIYQRDVDAIKLEDGQLWDNPGVPKKQFSVRFTSYFTPDVSGYYSLAGKGDDGYRILLDDVEVVSMWRNQGPTDGKADIFMNKGQEYKVVTEYYNDGAGAVIYQGIKHVVFDVAPTDMASVAVEAAKKADLVIMSVGFGPATEGEAFDRTFEMPYQQSELIQQVAAVNKNTLVVLNAGGNVDMSAWINKVNGLLMAWYPGQEGNKAVADILFGKSNPSGKLPVSFEKELKENPAFNYYFDKNKKMAVTYGEGLSVGYRYWDRSESKPRFPFGFGLSYTQFSIDKCKTNKTAYAMGDTVKIMCDVSNIGKMDGAQVVQVYVSDKESSLPRPMKELKGFEKVFLKKGETKTVAIDLTPDAFSFYDPTKHVWQTEAGDFDILVAHSSQDIDKTLTITLH